MLYVMGDEHDANVDDGVSVGVSIDISDGGKADYDDGVSGGSSVLILKVKETLKRSFPSSFVRNRLH
ncbi:hypothetical protein V1478_010862 [Vespula squamosa]|uniref:Uncharacterized protein n=1 Tax=Vespula squamosa TaxID=30214 RepID=A0ABD2AFU2_VESSQ